jgi:hypothetical protein
LHQAFIDDVRQAGIDDRRMRVSVEIHRHQRLLRVGENAAQRPFRGFAERLVHLGL